MNCETNITDREIKNAYLKAHNFRHTLCIFYVNLLNIMEVVNTSNLLELHRLGHQVVEAEGEETSRRKDRKGKRWVQLYVLIVRYLNTEDWINSIFFSKQVNYVSNCYFQLLWTQTVVFQLWIVTISTMFLMWSGASTLQLQPTDFFSILHLWGLSVILLIKSCFLIWLIQK